MMPHGEVPRQRLRLDGDQARVRERLRAWQEAGFCRRLWAKDPTLWASGPALELADRLGWLTLPETMLEQADDLAAFAGQVRAEGIRHVVLLGMGGSSLAPEVFAQVFGSADGFPALIVLDSTHPGAVRAADERIDPRETLFLVSSKSGTTIETLSLFQYFWHRTSRAVAAAGPHFVAITDPETPLARLAAERGFRRTFLAPPDVGGRYSALTVFGLVPAALIGVDVHRLLDRARRMVEATASRVPEAESPALLLGAALGELAAAGRDKVTFFATPSLAGLPAWIEQLIAESTGKDGTGIVPVVDEAPGSPDAYGRDRVVVSLRLAGERAPALDALIDALEGAGHPTVRIDLADAADLGGEFFRWEAAVAASGAVLGIHPFNQPDVQLAKELAQRAMDAAGARPDQAGRAGGRRRRVKGEASAARREALRRALDGWLAGVQAGDYIGLQAYLAPTDEAAGALQGIRRRLRDRLRIATTLGFGPRFLHSTGQLHKGGPEGGLFLQLVDDPADDLPVPETDYTFGALIRAQALGDIHALQQRGRRVLRLHLGRNPQAGLRRVADVLGG